MQKQMTWKDGIYIALILISGLSSYFSLKSSVNLNTITIARHEKMLQDNNLEVINAKIDGLNEKMDSFLDLLGNYIDGNKSRTR